MTINNRAETSNDQSENEQYERKRLNRKQAISLRPPMSNRAGILPSPFPLERPAFFGLMEPRNLNRHGIGGGILLCAQQLTDTDYAIARFNSVSSVLLFLNGFIFALARTPRDPGCQKAGAG